MVTASTPNAILGVIFGGVLCLLYGVHLITDAMQRDAGTRLRQSLLLLTRHPLAAFGIGLGITMLTQSSGATSSLLVGLVSVSLLALPIAIIALLGAGIGSALMVQVLIFHITDYAFVFLGAGAALAMITRRTAQRGVGQACFGVALVLLGLAALEAGSRPLAGNHLTVLVFDALIKSPLVLAIIGMALTMIFASSIAGIGLVIVLASTGSLPLVAAVALVLGANVGTTVTAMLTALSSGSVAGRRLALVHTGTRLVMACVGLLLLGPLMALLSQVHLPPATLVALLHLGFNLALAVVFVPLARPIAALVERLIPERAEPEHITVRYLHPDALSMPSVALGQATREILHMTDLITEMLRLSLQAFQTGRDEIPARIDALDDQLDELNVAIKRYLTQLDDAQMSDEQKQRQIALLYVITDLEAMGDLIDKQWMRLARRKRRRQVVFSDEGWQDLVHYHQEITDAVQQAFAALAAQDPALARAFFAHKVKLNRMKRTFHLRHLRRLQSGVPPSVESSEIHLDFLTAMRSVLSHASSIAHMVQEHLIIQSEDGDNDVRHESTTHSSQEL